MHFTTATAIYLLSITLSASAAALHSREIDTGFWQLNAKATGDPSAIAVPIALGSQPDNSPTHISNGAVGDVQVCIQLLRTVDSEGVPYKGAKVINHPTIAEDLYLWKTQGAKGLVTSTRINIGSGIRGNWTIVQDPNSNDLILALNGDTAAKQTNGGMHFGSDIPVALGGEPVTVVGVSVEAC